MCSNLFLNHKRHFLLNDYWNLNFNWFDFSLVDFNSLIFDTIAIGFDWDLSDNWLGYSLFDLNFDELFFSGSEFNQLLYFNSFVFFFFDNDNFLNWYLDWDFNILNDDLGY